MEKNKIVGIIAVVIIVAVVAVFVFGLQGSPNVLEEKINELKAEGYDVQEYSGTFSEAKAERPDVTFEETTDWNIFKQQVAATKQDLGFVTVWVHKDEGILWVARYEDKYYYYQVSP